MCATSGSAARAANGSRPRPSAAPAKCTSTRDTPGSARTARSIAWPSWSSTSGFSVPGRTCRRTVPPSIATSSPTIPSVTMSRRKFGKSTPRSAARTCSAVGPCIAGNSSDGARERQRVAGAAAAPLRSPAVDTLADLVRTRSRDGGPVLVDDASGAALSGAELAARVDARARMLVAAGVQPGDRVALLLPNSFACAETLLAAAVAGAAAVPVNLRWTAAEVDRLLADAEPRVLVAAEDRVAALGPLAHRPPLVTPDTALPDGPAPAVPDPDDPALILYTSGTTGRAKGAMLTHRNLLSNAALIARWLGLGPADRLLTVMPLFHANAIVIGLLTPLVAGGSTVIADRFRASTFWTSVERHRPTTAGTVPTILAMLLGVPAPARRTNLRFLLTGSAPVPADLLR